ncbi:GNAT family N-acetyltransferase [Caulobacter sp. DWR1-3-2b1]|uniref:GNAT family N-acetyltransferase n=1 Tax=Caulobacter sp. DWR1-3-2b1 TaxID=2804670 RepID=UPI003CE8D11A
MQNEAAEPLPVLTTPRLKLRCFRISDAPVLAANLTPAVTRWLATWPDPVSVALAAERIATARQGALAGWHVGYAIERLSDGVLIGGFGGGTADAPDPVDVGYHLAEHAHGQGYMVEAGRAAIAAMWDLLPMRVIEAVAQRENAASFAIMRRLGMTPTGQRLVHSPARDRWEWCGVQAIGRPT